LIKSIFLGNTNLRFIILTFFIIGLLVVQPAKCQFLDSIRVALQTKPKFLFKFDSRNSFVSNQSARIFGWKIGADFNGKFRIGGGLSSLSANHSPLLDRVVFAANNKDTIYIAKLSFNYVSYFVDYVFFANKKWEFSIPVQIGIGSSYYSYTADSLGEQQIDRGGIILYEPAITGQYKLTKWFGLGFGAGFRLMLVNNKAIDNKFNSPIYIFKAKVFLAELLRPAFSD
jgi:hypothetical protein